MEGISAREKRARRATRNLAIALVVLIVLSIVNWAVITGFGETNIIKMDLASESGLENTALLYVPETATVENPAPCIIMFHGISGNARNHESWAVEFARRGFVALSVDWYGNGGSDFNGQEITDTEWPALQQYIDYVKTMDNVNTDWLIISGHSMGTDPAYFLSCRNQPLACMMCNLISPGVSTTEETYNGNLLLLSGTADKSSKDSNYWDRCLSLLNNIGLDIDSVEVDKLYGSFETGDAKLVIRLQDMIHEAAFIDSRCIEDLLDFAQQSVGIKNIPNYIEGSQQIWMWKDVVGVISMFAFVVFMFMLAVFLMENVYFFGEIRQEMPRNIGLRGKGLAISIACAILFPLIVLRFGGPLYSLVTNIYKATGLFAGNMLNYAFCTVVGLNLLGLAFFGLFCATDAKKHKATLRDLGFATDANPHKFPWRIIGKAFLLALITVTCGWAYLNFQGEILGTDFYCLFFGFRPIPWNKFLNYIPYMIIWILAFTVAALGMNIERRLPSTGKESLDLTIAIVFNSLLSTFTVTVMVIVEDWVQINICGSETEALSTWGIAICRLWGMPVGMTLAGVGQTYLYRKSGSIWLGAITMGIICCLAGSLYGQFRV